MNKLSFRERVISDCLLFVIMMSIVGILITYLLIPMTMLTILLLLALWILVDASIAVDQEAHAEYERRLLERKRRNAK